MVKEHIVETVKKFKRIVTVTFVLGLIGVAVSLAMKDMSCYDMSHSPFRHLARILLLLIILGYIRSLTYLYKISKVLKLAGSIKIRPFLLLLLAVIGTPLGLFITIIIFVVIWHKAEAYIKTV